MLWRRFGDDPDEQFADTARKMLRKVELDEDIYNKEAGVEGGSYDRGTPSASAVRGAEDSPRAQPPGG